ncbi:hypothetical protein L0636_00940 [Halomonas janggokensis]|uniref:Uncharacterized protein n=1 Tax=Vreelandella janggokensis TaxID=370767 RepID=A0ABT4IT95_9GAMM|nr:hypothetical protein [Halomonas janggokensis]MCZ0926453.1 hypothetical protein [Halomonas janggokensis]MCZ0928991.1 hypothetical protein [Halomonas janggokensis]
MVLPFMGSGPLWDGINPNLIATIYEVDHKGEPLDEANRVRCLFVDDANLEATLNWQSPFEGAGPESRAPTLSAMLQSGAIQPIAERLGDGVGGATKEVSETARGRTGITKLNSTQVFSGMPPLRLQATIMLRAWRDPQAEVEEPLDQLMRWVLPQYLAPEGTMITAALDWYREGDRDVNGFVEAAMPSAAPSMIAIRYKGRTYAPMVVENIGVPLNSPSDQYGRFVQLQLPVTFATLTAIDRNDWDNMK